MIQQIKEEKKGERIMDNLGFRTMIHGGMRYTNNNYEQAFNMDYETYIYLKHIDAIMNL